MGRCREIGEHRLGLVLCIKLPIGPEQSFGSQDEFSAVCQRELSHGPITGNELNSRARKRPHHQVSTEYPALGSPSSHDQHGSLTQIDGSLQGSESLAESRSCGADPPKIGLRVIGGVRSDERRFRYASAGNGACMAAKNLSCGLETSQNVILRMRSLFSSAVRMLVLSPSRVESKSCSIAMGKGGQTASVLLTGIPALQTSSRFRRRDDRNAMLPHF